VAQANYMGLAAGRLSRVIAVQGYQQASAVTKISSLNI